MEKDKIFNVKSLRKEDLATVAEEIGVIVSPEWKIKDLKEKILSSEEFKNDPEFVAQFIITTVEDRKNKEEHQRGLELANAQNSNIRPEPVQSSEEDKISRLIKSIKTLTIPCPSKPELWYLFFSTLERAFVTKNVRADDKAEILLNLLGEKAANILIYIEDEDVKDYEKIKLLVLREFEPSAQNCLENFNRAKRQSGETHMQFASRLKTTLDYYLRLRKCDDFKTLCELMVTDKLFATLDQETQTHIGIRQGEKWFRPTEMGRECDTFFTSKGKSFNKQTLTEVNSQKSYVEHPNVPRENKYIPPHLRNSKEQHNSRYKNKMCFICGSYSHLQRDCDRKNKNADKAKFKPDKNASDVLSAKVETKYFESQIQPLEYVSIMINGHEIEAIRDSATQIPIFNPSVIPDLEIKGQGKIILTSAFGENTDAQLCRLPITLKNNEGQNSILEPVEILAAVTDKLNVCCLMPPNVLEMLEEGRVIASWEGEESESNAPMNTGEKEAEVCLVESESPEEERVEILNSDPISAEGMILEQRESDALGMRESQLACETLASVRKELRCGKGNYFMEDGLIFHRDKVLGESVAQLVLPRDRREKVLKLAHESVFGCHMGFRKTKQRIRYSFYWPEMTKDIAEFCKTCEACQLRKVNKISDRAPITAVVRPSLPFEVVNIDLIGKIEPPSGRGHQYVLCLVDQHTRWPEAIPLRSLTAKATCNALLEIFARTGIPNIIASDCGKNFTASLTKEFMRRLGSTPRFSTPGSPASNGLVERFNRVIKNMLHHVIREDPTNWDKQLPFLLWAYREVPNCTTGVSPFRLMYGREPKGPLAILKSTWAGEIHIPINITESATDYLQKLKVNMEIAAEKAALIAADKQKSYADYFNRRSSCRNFKVGEQVILLIPDSTNKLYARWTGPGEVIEQCSPHSYKVRLTDGSSRHVHVNKMRKFHPRAQTVGVIFEEDDEFGDIYSTPVRNHEAPDFISTLKLEHLETFQREELMRLLTKHEEMFAGKMRVAKVGNHKIRLIENSVRKKPHIYRIPETLKPKVDDQIKELLELNLIEPSEAEIAYPVVCVNKKDGSVRLCIDFRSLNEVTVKDDFPMQNINDLINTIGQGNVISTLDILKGYWEIPLEEKSRDLTSFKTHRAQYRWKVMPFGLKNAGATFQKTMNNALSDHQEYCKTYIDDVAVYSHDWKTHMSHLELVLTKLGELNFSVNVKKCDFARPNVKYLGHIIGSGKHQPDPEKLKAIKNIQPPKTKTQLRSLVGLFNYYRDYVKNFADIVHPLTELTKKGVSENIPWTENHGKALETLKSALCHAPTLFTPVLSKPYTIQTDASGYGVGACLSQKDENNILRPISFASQKLTKTQQAWPAIEREAYAIVWSFRKFETWIFGAHIDLITDHDPLTFITKGAPQSAKLQRWALALQRYDFSISHCAGKKLANADALSRLQ